ncbi:hypothetical protein CR513_04863, partial [Mucuna pruriens]
MVTHREKTYSTHVAMFWGNGGNNVNATSIRIVKKLNLLTLAHPRPYNVLAFMLEEYSNEVLCDIMPMELHIFSLDNHGYLTAR